MNYKDDLEKAFKWLNQYGNPYSVNLYDQDGTYGFNLGVSGAPETYLLKEDKILQKHIGIMSEKFGKINLFLLSILKCCSDTSLLSVFFRKRRIFMSFK